LELISTTKLNIPSHLSSRYWLKNKSVHFFALVLAATLFVEEHGFQSPYSRIIYSFFLYSSLLYFTINFLQREFKFNNYIYTTLFYIIFLIAIDLFNPKFKAITLFNNPIALFSVFPMCGFIVGYQTLNLSAIYKLLKILVLIFILTSIYAILTKNNFTLPTICSTAIIPFAALKARTKKIEGYISILMLFYLASIFSIISDFRILLFEIIFFVCFYLVLHFINEFRVIKYTIIITISLTFFFIIPNLGYLLEQLGRVSFLKELSTMDTRSDLYQNFFNDFHFTDYITGRGFLGTYFDRYFLSTYNTDQFGDHFIRILIEVGILQLLLKGGLILLFLYLYPLISAGLKGLRINKRSIQFGLSIYILSEVLIFSLENIPTFHFKFFILFFFAGHIYRVAK
jgi:hypothetical protein